MIACLGLPVSIAPKVCKTSVMFLASLTDKLCTHLQQNVRNTEKSLTSFNVKLDSKCVCEVLRRFSLTNPHVGLRFFIWAGYQPNYRHTSYTYSNACELFKIKRNPGVIFDLLETYRMENCVLTVKVLKVILNLCKEAELAKEALLVLKKMSEFGVRADTSAYNIVIRLFCDCESDMEMAQKLMGEMGLIDLYPDMVTCVSMIKGYVKMGRLEEACGLLKTMRKHGCIPNVVVYSTLIDGYCQLAKYDKAFELLEEMEERGSECSPNVVTYTSVIQNFCQDGRIKDALGILDKMETFGCAPNHVTIIVLIEGLCMNGLPDEAHKLAEKFVSRGMISHGDCYGLLVVSLIKIKKIDVAEVVFRRTLADGIRPDSFACSVMIRALCLDKRALDAFKLFDNIEKMKCLPSIDSDIYSILLHGLFQQGHGKEATILARFMLQKRIPLEAPYIDQIVEYMKRFVDREFIAHLTNI